MDMKSLDGGGVVVYSIHRQKGAVVGWKATVSASPLESVVREREMKSTGGGKFARCRSLDDPRYALVNDQRTRLVCLSY